MLAGLDLGTTGSKISIYDLDGNKVDKFYKSYITSRNNSSAEIDAEEIFSAVKTLIKEACSKYNIDSIGVDSFGEAFVMLDKDDKPLAPIIVQTDSRGIDEYKELSKIVGKRKIEEITGLTPKHVYSLPKIMWFKKNKPTLFNKCTHILMVEDYIIYMLTGNAIIDYSLATRSLAFDIKKLEFSKEILSLVGIDFNLFSKPVGIGFNCGKIKSDLLDELHILNAPVIATAGHDQVSVALGSSLFKVGEAIDGAGTVECITPLFDENANNSSLIKNNYAKVPYFNSGEYLTYAYSFTSGCLIDWFIATFAKDLGKDAFSLLESEFKPEPTGILVLPHFAGAGIPYLDPYSKGAIVGLTLENTLSEIYKSVLEGIAYEMKINVNLLKKSGVKINKLIATGGGASSKKWLQIKSDILNLPIDILSDKESGSKGAAIAAGLAINVFENIYDATSKMVQVVEQITPNPKRVNEYKKHYLRYKKLYTAVKGVL